MKIALVFLAVLLAGCVSAPPSATASMFSVGVGPDDLFTSGSGKATLEFTNTGAGDVKNVDMSVFDPGALQASQCTFSVGDTKKGSFVSRTCELVAPGTIEQNVITTEVKARASFDSTLSGADTISAMSENEYRIEQAKGAVPKSSPVYVHSDGRLKATVSFSEQMPVVKRNTALYMYIDITNIGNGRIDTIDAGAITVAQPGISPVSATTTITYPQYCENEAGYLTACVKCPDGSYHIGSTDIKDCPSYVPPTTAENLPKISCPLQKLYIQGTSFPRVTCEITLPDNVNYLSYYTLILSINYPYEIRASHTVQVRR